MSTSKKVLYVAQHSATTFLLAYLLALQTGVNVREALISAGILTLRDLKSLFDDIFSNGKHPILSKKEEKDGLSSGIKGV